jgi:hypothetical protein
VVHLHDPPHQRFIRELDEVEDAAAQERVRQLLLVVAGDHHHGAMLRADLLVRLEDLEPHAIQFVEQVVGEFDVRLVDLVDQQDDALARGEGLTQRPQLDVVLDVAHVPIAEARVVQPLHRVVDVQPVLRARGALHMPREQLEAEAFGDRFGEQRLPGAGLALHQQRTLEHQRAVHRGPEPFAREVPIRSLKASKLRGHVLEA